MFSGQSAPSTSPIESLMPANEIINLRLASAALERIDATVARFRLSHSGRQQNEDEYLKLLQAYRPDTLSPLERNSIYYLSDPRIYYRLCQHGAKPEVSMKKEQLEKISLEVRAALTWASTSLRDTQPTL